MVEALKIVMLQYSIHGLMIMLKLRSIEILLEFQPGFINSFESILKMIVQLSITNLWSK